MHAKQSYLNRDYSVWNRNEDMPLYHIFKLIILLILACFFAEFWHRLHWLKTPGLMLSTQGTGLFLLKNLQFPLISKLIWSCDSDRSFFGVCALKSLSETFIILRKVISSKSDKMGMCWHCSNMWLSIPNDKCIKGSTIGLTVENTTLP